MTASAAGHLRRSTSGRLPAVGRRPAVRRQHPGVKARDPVVSLENHRAIIGIRTEVPCVASGFVSILGPEPFPALGIGPIAQAAPSRKRGDAELGSLPHQSSTHAT